MPPGRRPNLADPRAVAGLLTSTECLTLAQCGYCPIPATVIRLGCTPAEHRQRQAHQLIGTEMESFRDEIAEQLPAAVEVILENYTK
jgi:hypothetical protein